MMPAVTALRKVRNLAYCIALDCFHHITLYCNERISNFLPFFTLISPQVLNTITIESPLIPVHSNVDGRYYKNAEQVKKQLPKQICKPVKWEQTMHIIYERNRGTAFPATYECGPGRSLKTILKMCNAKAFDSCSTLEA